jgi:hypothetical protein
MSRSILAMALLFACAGPALAAEDATCDPSVFAADIQAAGLAHVAKVESDGRLHFSADSRGRPCPAVACSLRAYVLKGDELLTGRRLGAWRCAWFKPRAPQSGFGSVGWLRDDALTPVPFAASPALSAWVGRWVRDRPFGLETSLNVRPAPGGRLKVKGSSLFAHSRADVDRGAVNDGEIDDVVDVHGRLAGLLIPGPRGASRSMEPETYKFECRFGMALLGDRLFVADDTACGGLNVSFTGVYRRER